MIATDRRSDASGKDCYRWERRAYRAQGLREGWLRRTSGAIDDVQVEKPYHAASDDDDDSVVDEANAYAEGSVLRSAALKHVPVGR